MNPKLESLKELIKSYDGAYSEEQNVYIDELKGYLDKFDKNPAIYLHLMILMSTKLAETHMREKQFEDAQKCFKWIQMAIKKQDDKTLDLNSN